MKNACQSLANEAEDCLPNMARAVQLVVKFMQRKLTEDNFNFAIFFLPFE